MKNPPWKLTPKSLNGHDMCAVLPRASAAVVDVLRSQQIKPIHTFCSSKFYEYCKVASRSTCWYSGNQKFCILKSRLLVFVVSRALYKASYEISFASVPFVWLYSQSEVSQKKTNANNVLYEALRLQWLERLGLTCHIFF